MNLTARGPLCTCLVLNERGSDVVVAYDFMSGRILPTFIEMIGNQADMTLVGDLAIFMHLQGEDREIGISGICQMTSKSSTSL